MSKTATPWTFEVVRVVAEGEVVALHMERVGTTRSGNDVRAPAMGFFEVRDGWIAHVDAVADAALAEQLPT